MKPARASDDKQLFARGNKRCDDWLASLPPRTQLAGVRKPINPAVARAERESLFVDRDTAQDRVAGGEFLSHVTSGKIEPPQFPRRPEFAARGIKLRGGGVFLAEFIQFRREQFVGRLHEVAATNGGDQHRGMVSAGGDYRRRSERRMWCGRPPPYAACRGIDGTDRLAAEPQAEIHDAILFDRRRLAIRKLVAAEMP